MDWINKIELKVQMLVIARVPALAINSAFCGNVIACLGNFGNHSSTTATRRWVARADTLLASNNTFFSAAHIKKAFFLGQNQGPKSSTQPKDWGGNNKNWSITCPHCKITHPEGIKSCPHYDTHTNELIEKNKAKLKAESNANQCQFKKAGGKEKVLDKHLEELLPCIDVHAFLANTMQDPDFNPSANVEIGQQLLEMLGKGHGT
eukprot:1850635-Rhodomonas_salina.1